MPHNDKILRDAPFGSVPMQPGIVDSNILVSDHYLQNPANPQLTPDPLATSSKAANKPGSSIPSIFGRMIFFQTALKNANIGGNQHTTPSVYDKTVSHWLDLLEGIFSRPHNYKFIRWDRAEQIKLLSSTTHKVLHDAFENQFDKYFGNRLKELFIIKDKDGKLIGCTSPYTLVFTSPAYSRNSTAPIRPFLSRDEKFRLFLYSVMTALGYNINIPTQVSTQVTTPMGLIYTLVPNPAYQLIESLCKFLERNLNLEDIKIQTKVTAAQINDIPTLLQKYDPVTYDEVGNMPVSIVNLDSVDVSAGGTKMNIAGDIALLTRKAGAIESDFFIDGDRTGITTDTSKLPLILPNQDLTGAANPYAGMLYIDSNFWNHHMLMHPEVYSIENTDEASIELPNSAGIKHNWLSAKSFFEDRLIRLPYKMDSSHFKSVINIGSVSYLIPLRPKAFKYLKESTVLNGRPGQGEGFKFSYNEETRCLECSLDIPVRNNDGTRKSFVRLVRTYNIDSKKTGADVLNPSGLKDFPVSVGISPFMKLNESNDNRYDVMLHHGPLCIPDHNPYKSTVDKISLQFFNDAANPFEPVEPNREYATAIDENEVRQTLYKLRGRDFNMVRVVCDMADKTDPVAGLVILNWDTPSTGDQKNFYAIDFGTTNTHIAYLKDKKAFSFNSEELKQQAVYLAHKENITEKAIFLQTHTEMDFENACNRIYGDQANATLLEQSRRFFPNFELEQFKFPIRSAAYVSGTTGNEIFNGFSVGFNYSHEEENKFISKYLTELKWDIEQNKPGAEEKAKLFFVELLLMVRNHWLHTPGIDLESLPHIVITTPLAMKANNIFTIWAAAYAEVFGVGETLASTEYLHEMSESLAPAYVLISNGKFTVNGLLNIDIGGGTTDLQYYRKENGKTIAFYNSEIFAADDLWGCGHENVKEDEVASNITDNVFTRFADQVMPGNSITIGTSKIDYSALKGGGLNGKELIGRLLRDSNNSFALKLHSHPKLGRNTPALKVIFLHYSAIMYHVAKWVMSDPHMAKVFPKVINFTGFGSKYINILFGDNTEGRSNLTEFTRKLLIAYGVPEKDADVEISFSDNPKNITAEGAAIYAKASHDGEKTVIPGKRYYYGYNGCNPAKSPTFGEASKLGVEIGMAVEEYINGFTHVQSNSNLDIPSLSRNEIENLKSKAADSYKQMANDSLGKDAGKSENKVYRSLFFWSLKDALFNFDQYESK